MSGSMNRVFLVGRLGKDPEVRYTTGGTAVATFSLATDETFKYQSGEKQSRTEWHTVVCWSKLAEIVGQYAQKGKQVLVEGKIQTRSYEKDGVTKYVTEIRASQVVLLGSANGGNNQEKSGHSPSEPFDDDIAF